MPLMFAIVIPKAICIYHTVPFCTSPCTQTPHSHPHSPASSPPVSRKMKVNV